MLTAKKSNRARWRVLVTWLMLAACMASAGGSKSVGEYQVKAVFLYNFTKFVSWPANAPTNTPFVIGIVGEDPFGTVLDEAVRQELMHNRPILIQRLRDDESATNCQMLFISRSEKDRINDVLERVRGRAILTVADAPQAAEQGVMINLLVVQGSVKMEINQNAVEAAGLQVSAKVLSLARIVNTETDGTPSKP